jgi:hypothetical protein
VGHVDLLAFSTWGSAVRGRCVTGNQTYQTWT